LLDAILILSGCELLDDDDDDEVDDYRWSLFLGILILIMAEDFDFDFLHSEIT
jgi:hypothetical protein